MARAATSPTARRILLISSQVLFVVALVAIWASVSQNPKIAFVLGSPSKIFGYVLNWLSDGSLWGHLGATLAAASVGWVVGVTLGSLAGIVIGTMPRLHQVFSPFFAFWLAFPRIVYYPFFAIALGYSVGSRMVHVVFVIIFLVIINTAAGINEVDRGMVANVEMLGGGKLSVLQHVYIPSALAWVMTSARFTAGIALQSAIVAEFIGAASGIGYLTVLGQNRFDVNFVWAAILLVVIVAFAIDRLLELFQKRLSRWHAA